MTMANGILGRINARVERAVIGEERVRQQMAFMTSNRTKRPRDCHSAGRGRIYAGPLQDMRGATQAPKPLPVIGTLSAAWALIRSLGEYDLRQTR